MNPPNEYQFISDKTEPQVIVNENAQPVFEQGLLPSYEDMMCEDVFNGPSSMETQPDLAPVKVLEEGVAVTQGGRTVEWWPIERPLDLPKQPHLAPVHIIEEGVAVTQDGRQVEWWPPNLDEVALQEYLMDASKPLHTNFVLPKKGLANCYTCPVYFGNADSVGYHL